MEMAAPVQIAVLGITEAAGRGFIVTVTESEFVHPDEVFLTIKV